MAGGRLGGSIPPSPAGPRVSGPLIFVAFIPVLVILGVAAWLGGRWGWTHAHEWVVGVGSGAVLAALGYPLYCWARTFLTWAELERRLHEAGVDRRSGRLPTCLLVLYWRGQFTIKLHTSGHVQADLDEVAERFRYWLGDVVEVGEVQRFCVIRAWKRSAHRDDGRK